MKQAYTFDDIALVPQFNNVPSRTIPSLETWLTKDQKIDIPILAANMDTVIGPELAKILLAYGSMPILHRFAPMETQLEWVKKFEGKCYVSTGLFKEDNVRLLFDNGALGVCIDIAHGHCSEMIKCIGNLKKTHPKHQIIAGNVCTSMGYHDLANAGADAIKVGIGGGAACTTRIVTGFGVPQFTAIRDCAETANRLRVPIISDGGIRNSRDIMLALAAGASSVMIGKLFALTYESAATRIYNVERGEYDKKYRGQASQDFQEDYYGQVKTNTVPEGISFIAPESGTASKLIDELLGGIRSGLTYGGSKSIKELQRKAEFVQVTSSYGTESNPRPV